MRFPFKQFLYSILLLLVAFKGKAQTIQDVEKIPSDSLRGHLYPWRAAIDVLNYNINLEVKPKTKTINGFVTISFKVLKPTKLLQWDLDTALQISHITSKNPTISQASIKRKHSAVFLQTNSVLTKGIYKIILHYAGKPKESKQPPWDGGFVWKTDSIGTPWIGLAVEGEGASLWFPCKDHLSDKATFIVTCTAPKPLKYIGNGKQFSYHETDTTTTTTWGVAAQAPTYSISLNIGRYQHIPDSMIGLKGKLNLDYYVLPENIEKAKTYFSKEVKPMITAFEKRLGPYPFYADGYALIQTPYWGMEHQSGIAYGNNFVKNKANMDFIIVHESAHEWWGNSLSCSDHANMFIQEGYCTYSEFLYLEETKTHEEIEIWLKHHYNQIRNKYPMRGPEHINYLNSDTDIYYKYALVLYTIRQLIGDTKFNDYLKNFYNSGKNKSITYAQFQASNTKYLGKKYAKLLEWYITNSQLPTIQYKKTKNGVYIRWDVTKLSNIAIPIEVQHITRDVSLSNTWQKIAPSAPNIEIKLAKPYLLFNLQQIR
jgi:aminopeptidase N